MLTHVCVERLVETLLVFLYLVLLCQVILSKQKFHIQLGRVSIKRSINIKFPSLHVYAGF